MPTKAPGQLNVAQRETFDDSTVKSYQDMIDDIRWRLLHPECGLQKGKTSRVAFSGHLRTSLCTYPGYV